MIDFEIDPKLKMLREMARAFAKAEMRPIALECDRTYTPKDSFLIKAYRAGISLGGAPRSVSKTESEFFGANAKGAERTTNRLAALSAEELCWGDAALLMSLPGPGLGGPPLAFTGTPEQQKKYFSIFSKEDPLHFGAYGLTEPGAGSDVSGISTTCRKDGDYYVLNGTKCFITNGGKADWVVVFGTLDKSKGKAAHRAFMVEKGAPGFTVGKIEKKMGLRCSETAELILDNVRLHKDQLLGGEAHYEKLGSGGFKTAMKTFDSTRPMVASMALGITRAAYEEGVAFAKAAYCLSRPLPHYQSLRDKLAQWERKIEAARLLIWHAAWMSDLGIPNSKEASMSKAYAGKISKEICREVYELVAGRGWPQEAFVDKWFRDIQIFDIFEGTGQVQRLIISRRFMEGLSID